MSNVIAENNESGSALQENKKYSSVVEYESPNTFGFRAAASFSVDFLLSPILGFSYEWVPKWTGIEIGAYYTNYYFEGWREDALTGDFRCYAITNHHLVIPIAWKVHTKYVNIALGIKTMLYLNYSVNEKKTRNYDPRDFSIPSFADIGAYLQVGFPIKLNRYWSLEPNLEVRYSYEHLFEGSLGVSFRLNKLGK